MILPNPGVVKKYLPSDPERPSVYLTEEGNVGYRASELGRCIRALVLCRLGYVSDRPDEKSMRAMNEGNVHEPHAAHWWEKTQGGRVLRQIRISMKLEDVWAPGIHAIIGGVSDGIWFEDESEAGYLDYEELKNNSYFDPITVVLSEEPFPVIKPKSGVWGIEIKAPDDFMFQEMSNNGPGENYKWQMSIYWHCYEQMLGIKLAGFVFVLRRRRDGMEFSQKFTEPFYTKLQIEERIETVERLAEKGHDAADCDRTDYFCRYWKFHKPEVQSTNSGKQKSDARDYDPAIKHLAKKYKEANDGIADLTLLKASLKEKIEIQMRGRDKVKTDGFSLYYTSSNFISETQLLQENPDLENKFQKFDLDACLEAYPDMKQKYTIPGKRSLTVRSVKGGDPEDLEKPKKQKISKPVKMGDLDAEDMDEIFKHI